MDVAEVFIHLGLALGLGLLVGLEREHAEKRLAGIRTFPLATAFGTVCAFLAGPHGGLVVAAGFVSLALLLVAANLVDRGQEGRDPGLTTEVAMLLMYAVGVYLVQGSREVAIVVGAGVAVLLQAKAPLHRMVRGLTDQDLTAIMRFVLVALVTLPVLPDRTFGPYDVLNPRSIWFMVVLIVGFNLSGYIAYKFAGERAGVVLMGILGGLISSTATTVSSARSTRKEPRGAIAAALVVVMASAIVFGRIIAMISIVAPSVVGHLAPPLATMLALMLAFAVAMTIRHRKEAFQSVAAANPSELKWAFGFAATYAAVLLAIAAVRELWGEEALYAVAVVSGLTDVDAITLSTSQLVAEGRIAPATGWRVILAATLSNLAFKGAIVAVMGHRELLSRIAGVFGAAIVAGIGLILAGGALFD